MIEKIKETKTAILDRIIKAVADETKSLSAETLKIMAEIVDGFDYQEIKKDEPKFDPTVALSNVLNKATNNAEVRVEPKEVI